MSLSTSGKTNNSFLSAYKLDPGRKYNVRLSIGQTDCTYFFQTEVPHFLNDKMSAYATSSRIDRSTTSTSKYTDTVQEDSQIISPSTTYPCIDCDVTLKPKYSALTVKDNGKSAKVYGNYTNATIISIQNVPEGFEPKKGMYIRLSKNVTPALPEDTKITEFTNLKNGLWTLVLNQAVTVTNNQQIFFRQHQTQIDLVNSTVKFVFSFRDFPDLSNIETKELRGFSGMVDKATEFLQSFNSKDNTVTIDNVPYSSLMPNLLNKTPEASDKKNHPMRADSFPKEDEWKTLMSLKNKTANGQALWKQGYIFSQYSYVKNGKITEGKTTTTFTNNLSIISEIGNQSIFEQLYWEKDVKDYIYFFISDNSKENKNKWFVFETDKDIIPAELKNNKTTTPIKSTKKYFFKVDKNNKLVLYNSDGTRMENSNMPPKISMPPDRPTSARCKFFIGHKTVSGKTMIPFGVNTLYIRFAIARYTKQTDGQWLGKWLPYGNNVENILSTIESLNGK